MAIDRDNLLNAPLEEVKKLLQASTSWQDWCGVSTAADTAPYTWTWVVDVEDEELPSDPMAFIKWPGGFQADKTGGGEGNVYLHSGTVELQLWANVPDEYLDSGSKMCAWLASKVSPVLNDMKALAGSGAYIDVSRFRCPRAPAVSEKAEGTTPADSRDIMQRILLEWSE